MQQPKNKYPRFYSDSGEGLVAILAPDRMFALLANQYGKGDGFEFRIYKTQATVRKYAAGRGEEITFPVFKLLLSNVFAKYILEIEALLPKEILKLEVDQQNRISDSQPKMIK